MMEFDNDFNVVYKNKPTDPLCDKPITVDVVGTRCIYLNDHRIAGGKPYVSEGLPQRSMSLTVRAALEAFPIKELEAYIAEKKDRQEYFAAYHVWKDSNKPPSKDTP